MGMAVVRRRLGERCPPVPVGGDPTEQLHMPDCGGRKRPEPHGEWATRCGRAPSGLFAGRSTPACLPAWLCAADVQYLFFYAISWCFGTAFLLSLVLTCLLLHLWSWWQVCDLGGNVWEMTDEFSDQHNRAVLLKGGSHYYAKGSMW